MSPKTNTTKKSKKYTQTDNQGKQNIKKRSTLKSLLFIFILAVTVAAAFLFLTNRYIFKVGKIEVSENPRYTRETILDIAGISKGMELYALPLREIEYNIKSSLPYIKNAKITRIPPSTLRINITMEKGALGIKLGWDYYILSESFKALEKISILNKSEENIVSELLADNIIIFDTHTIKECYVGRTVQFQDEDIADFLRKVLKVVEENEIHGIIDKIDLADKFYIKMEYDGRFSVELGRFEDIELKILTLIAVIDELPEDARGIFERNNEKSWSFIPSQW